METAFKFILAGLLASWVSAALFGLRNLAEVGPYWKRGDKRSGQLTKGGLISAGCFLAFLLAAFLTWRRLYGEV